MANMSYCRFENTLGDLDDCADALEDFFGGDTDEISSERELRCAGQLVTTCYEILSKVADQEGCTLAQFVSLHNQVDVEAAFDEIVKSLVGNEEEEDDEEE